MNIESDSTNSCDEAHQISRKSLNDHEESCADDEMLAFELEDSNSNGTDSEDLPASQNISASNVNTEGSIENLSNPEMSLPEPYDVGQPDSGNVPTVDFSNTCDSNNDVFENDSVTSNPTSAIDCSPTQNLDLKDASPNEMANSSGGVKDSPAEYADVCTPEPLNPETECENEINSSDVPNGIAKTMLFSDLKNISSTKCATYNKKKLKKIWEALEKGDVDFLKEAAITQGGLINDDVRKKVWPKLVGADVVESSPRPCIDEIKAHPYYQQVVLDVNRSLKRFPPSIKEAQRLTMLDQLVFLIMRVLCRHPELHYYQGYHDICVTFLLVLGEETAYHVVEKLSRTHLNVFMEKTMEPTIHLLEYIYLLIGKKDSLLKSFLLKSEVGVAYCLSWLITWFGHVLNDYDNVVRLFDLFIVSHPWMPMYLTSIIVLHREVEILKQECDMASVHSLLANISDDLPFEDLILQALSLHKNFTPKMLSYERPYVKRNKGKVSTGWRLIQSVSKTIKSAVPASNYTLPLVIAAAVLVTAVLYQVYKH